MSTIWASGAIVSITPRQIGAGPSGPKSVRKLMKGRGMAAMVAERPGSSAADARGAAPPETSKRRLEEGRRRFEECAATAGGGTTSRRVDSGCRLAAPSPPDASVDRRARLAEVAGSVHLAKEEELIDLAERPVRLADLDPGHESGQVGGLVRRQAPKDEIAVGRPGWESRARGLAGGFRRGGDGRPRHARGDRRGNRPRARAA